MKNLILASLFLALFSCTDDEFTKTTTGSSKQISPVQVKVEEKCSNFTPPPVDILLLTDNTGSVGFLNADLKGAISSIVSQAQNFFDYRIYVAPLVGNFTETNFEKRSYQIIPRVPQNLPSSVNIVGVNELVSPYSYNTNNEKGFQRAIDLIQVNSHTSDLCHEYGWNLDHIGTSNGKLICLDSSCGEDGFSCSTSGTSNFSYNGVTYKSVENTDYYRVWRDGEDNSLYGNDYVFRKGAHLAVILISNGDDNDNLYDYQGNPIGSYFNQRKSEFLQLRNNIEAPQIRFLSVVNHSECGATVRDPGNRYKAMSVALLNDQGVSATGSTPDSFDLCQNNLSTIFNSIAVEIENFKRGHTYNFWPLGSTLDFDPNKLVITKKPSGQVLANGDSNNGYTFLPTPEQNKNIRETPPVSQLIPAELESGYFVQLNGAAKVTYPECLVVRKTEFTKYFGYFVIQDRKPDPSSIQVFLDGVALPQSSTNGWEYVGFQEGQNLLVESPQNPVPVVPSDEIYTGYVIKFNGSAIISNDSGRDLQVRYLPAPF